jgi:LysR family glycine cleavage system transcriptional activator
MHLPSYKFLRTFQVVARLLSFKAAAEELFVTPSAVSHHIRSLEDQLGIALFRRGVRAITLTDAGKHYLQQVNDIVARFESVNEELRVRYGRSIIRLNVPPFFANELLLPRLASCAFSMETDIRIETRFGTSRTHPPDADLSIVVGAGPWEDFTAHELFAQSFVAACSPAFLLSNPIDTYADLNDATLLQHEDRPDGWERWARSAGIRSITPARLIRLDNISAVVLAAEQGVGIALVPPRLCAARFAAGGLVKLFGAELTTNEHYVLLHRREDHGREDLWEFIQWIVKEFCNTHPSLTRDA